MVTHNSASGITDFSYEQWRELAQSAGMPHGCNPAEGFFGWGGFGGSAINFNPKDNVGVAYCMAGLGNPLWSAFGMADPRCLRLMEATQQCRRQQAPSARL